jgi:Protein of unknown function (DUF1501)
VDFAAGVLATRLGGPPMFPYQPPCLWEERANEASNTVAENPATAHDLHGTMLHCLGIDHTPFIFESQGLDFQLTGVEPARAMKELIT